jgi:hypothetical protein
MSSSSWHNARNWRLGAEEIRTLADEMRDDEAKSIMLRIAADYEKLAAFAEKASGASLVCFCVSSSVGEAWESKARGVWRWIAIRRRFDGRKRDEMR